jgi:hypothetical protein
MTTSHDTVCTWLDVERQIRAYVPLDFGADVNRMDHRTSRLAGVSIWTFTTSRDVPAIVMVAPAAWSSADTATLATFQVVSGDWAYGYLPKTKSTPMLDFWETTPDRNPGAPPEKPNHKETSS